MGGLRIAILAHSTNPRGGVVHALEVGDALTRRGHDVTVHAPDSAGRGFFRATLCRTCPVPAAPVPGGLSRLVAARVAEYLRHFAAAAARRFDVFHAQDGISGNALATLAECGMIPGFARTVHHVDDFADAAVARLQRRAIVDADTLLVVSRRWRDWLAGALHRPSIVVGNGVDTRRFTPIPDDNDAALRTDLRLPEAVPVFLAIGGVEARKNTLGILEAFVRVRAAVPHARLLIAGGASLLDHGDYQARFAAALAASGLPDGAVMRIGTVAQARMPALYRLASALVFPSLNEGFGLVVLEAMASGVPAVAPRIAPFTEYLEAGDVLWCDPHAPASIAEAMLAALRPPARAVLAARGPRRSAAFGWDRVARAHEDAYATLRETVHA